MVQEQSTSKKTKQRLLSIDALRGFDMIWILGAEGIFAALFLLTGWSVFSVLADQMKHTLWHGITAYDVIFPLFIFLSGVSLGLAAKPMHQYPVEEQGKKVRHAIKRLALLIALGIVYNHSWGTGIPLMADEIRFASVLGRIAIAWFFAAIFVWYLTTRQQVIVSVGILIGYWLLLALCSIAGYGGGNYSDSGALNAWFDKTFLPGISYQNLAIDPEGVLSNIPSIVNAMAGVFIGRMIKFQQNSAVRLMKNMVAAGIGAIIVGIVWGEYFPINKTLWTSSFVLVTVGISTLLLALFYWLIDVLKWQRWAVFFSIIGTNSIIAYLASAIIDFNYIAHSLFGGVIRAVPEPSSKVFEVVFLVMVQWLILLWLYKRKIFIKV